MLSAEEQRLKILNELQILDSNAEECFDSLVRVAAATYAAPIALISLVDRDRQWLKARVGLEVSSTPRSHAFCAHTILSDSVMVVPDASEDPRFRHNPLVVGEPHIRFYAGAPLCAAPGLRIGTVCVIDSTPRLPLGPKEEQTLQDLANTVMNLLNMRAVGLRVAGMESALQQSERNYRELFDNCPVGIYRTAPDGTFLLANPAVVKMLGYESFDELQGERLQRNEVARTQHLFQEQLNKNGSMADHKSTWRKKNGATVWVKESVRMSYGEDGQICYYEGTAEDITEQHLTAARLQDQEERWRIVLRNNNDGVWEWEPKTGRAQWSDQFYTMLGYEPGECDPSYCVWNYLHPDDVKAVEDAVNRYLGGETQFYSAEFRMRCKDGSYHWVSTRGQLLTAESDANEVLIGSVTDITARKQDEHLLRAAEERYRSLFELCPLPIFVFAFPSLKLLAANQATEAAYEIAFKDHPGMTVLDLRPPSEREQIRRKLEGMKEFPYRWQPEPIRRRDGSLMHIIATVHPIQFESEEARIVIVNDITDATLAQQRMEAALKEAQDAAEAKSRFLATVSHEIRTPLNGVIGMTDLLLGTSLDEEQRDFANIIVTSSEILLNLLNDVLDYSKGESGALTIEQLDVYLHDVVKNIIDAIGAGAGKKNLQLAVHLDPTLPKVVRGDPGRLCQILLNLLNNAVKFTSEGAVKLTIQTEGANRIRFSVTDTGIGIAPEVIPNLFQPFTQADSSTTRRYGGTGLGLAIARNLVERMGGEIGCDSKLGEGSTFWFAIPFIRSIF